MRKNILLAALFFAGTAVGSLRLCSKCGHEAEETALRCGNCKNELSDKNLKVDKSEDHQASEKTIGPDGYLSASHVDKEIAKGRTILEEKKYATAVYFFRNAAALNYLVKPAEADKRTETITKAINYSEEKARKINKACKPCQGTGKATVYMKGLSKSSKLGAAGNRNKVTASFKKCPRCSGRGSLLQNMSIENLQGKYGQALAHYKTLQKNQRLTRIGQAWIDSEIADNLSLEQEVILRKASALPCDDCMGTGFQDCRDCDGLGKTECKASGCMDGMIENSVEGGGLKGTESVKRLQKCSTCYGNAYIICEDCDGTGGKTCKDCKGTGERDICSKCEGEGLSKCRRCRGSGEYKDKPCEDCDAKGVVRCTSCNGDGRRD